MHFITNLSLNRFFPPVKLKIQYKGAEVWILPCSLSSIHRLTDVKFERISHIKKAVSAFSASPRHRVGHEQNKNRLMVSFISLPYLNQ
jgi:hypothetical protein